MTARYIVKNKFSQSKRGGDRVLQWENKVERYIEHAVCSITRLFGFYLDENEKVENIRRVHSTKNKKKFSAVPVFKYGIKVTCTV